MRPITVTVTTRHRPAALERCLRSLRVAADLIQCAIVVDDASEPPVDSAMVARCAAANGVPIHLVRLDVHTGTAAAKNVSARLARTPAILTLDDDAFLVSRDAVADALGVLMRDPGVAGVAFAQGDERGEPRHAAIQPSRSDVPCYVAAFIGFACLLSRQRLLDAGGYRDEFIIHGEERELCLRWLDAGLRVVFLPAAVVAHVAEPGNRDHRAYVRLVIRNDCINALYNEPFALAMVSIPVRLRNFTRMAAGVPGGDQGGLRWIIGELRARWPGIRRKRRPVRWQTLRAWRRMRTSLQPYFHASH